MTNSEVEVILIDNAADLLKVQTDPIRLLIQNINKPQTTLTEASNIQNNKLIPSLTDASMVTSTTDESCTVHDPGSRNCAVFVLYTVSIGSRFL